MLRERELVGSWTGLAGAAVLAAAVVLLLSGPARATSPATSVTGVLFTTSSPEGIVLDLQRGLAFVAAGAETTTEPSEEGADDVTTEPATGEGSDAAISIFDAKTQALLGTVATPSNTEYLLYAQDRQQLYVSTADDSGVTDDQAVTVIDTQDPAHATIVKTILLPVDPTSPDGKRYRPEGVALDPANQVLYVAAKSVEKPCSVFDPREPDECEEPPQKGAIIAIDVQTDDIIPDALFPAGDDPESLAFDQRDGRVYAANEDDGTLTIVDGVRRNADGSFTLPGTPTTSRVVFSGTCPNADPGGDFDEYNEADKLAVDQTTGTVYLTDDLWRVAAIPKNWDGSADVPVQTIGSCAMGELGADYANNVAVDESWGNSDANGVPHGLVYVSSEDCTIPPMGGKCTVAVLDGKDLHPIDTITVPQMLHLDAIAVNSFSHEIWITDEDWNRISILVSADTVAPVTTGLAAPVPDAGGWNHEPVTLTFTANDDETGASGVKEIHVAQGGAEHVVDGATASLTVSSEGTTTVEYWAVDQAGNVEAKHTVEIMLDVAAPLITSGSTTTFTVGSAGSFTVTTSGTPTPTLSKTGDLPGGVTFTDNGDGTATLAGTPAAGTAGSYPLTITAANGVAPDASQALTLTVNAPATATPVTTITAPAHPAAAPTPPVTPPVVAPAPTPDTTAPILRATFGYVRPLVAQPTRLTGHVVTTRLTVDGPAKLDLRVTDRKTGRIVLILKGSRLSDHTSRSSVKALLGEVRAAGSVPVRLVLPATLRNGRYTITVSATDAAGNRSVITLGFAA